MAAMRARSKFGMAMAAMIRMMATTISSSISEKPFCLRISNFPLYLTCFCNPRNHDALTFLCKLTPTIGCICTYVRRMRSYLFRKRITGGWRSAARRHEGRLPNSVDTFCRPATNWQGGWGSRNRARKQPQEQKTKKEQRTRVRCSLARTLPQVLRQTVNY